MCNQNTIHLSLDINKCGHTKGVYAYGVYTMLHRAIGKGAVSYNLGVRMI